MVSEDELFDMSCEEFEDGHSRDCWRDGFRASEKIYLDKIQALEEKLALAENKIKTARDIADEWLRQNERKE